MENIHGREIVESGNLCERKNGRGVDSNRNWPVHWGVQEKDYDPSEEFPGSNPFRCSTGASEHPLLQHALNHTSISETTLIFSKNLYKLPVPNRS